MFQINQAEYNQKVAEIKADAARRQETLRRELEYYGDSSGLKVDALTGEVDWFREEWGI